MAYQMINEITWALLTPESYIGSVEIEQCEKNVVKFVQGDNKEKDIKYKVVKENVFYCAGIERVFLNILRYAIDNNAYMKCIKVTVKDGWVTIYNEAAIPLNWAQKLNMYIPQMVFTKNLCYSNCHLSNMFSEQLKIKIKDGSAGKTYEQSFSNNMRNIREPIIKTIDKDDYSSFTEISYKLDFSYFYRGDNLRFNRFDYDETMISLMAKHTLDASFITGFSVYFNDVLFNGWNPIEYAKAFINVDNKQPIIIDNLNTKLILLKTPNKGFIHSFVNGCHTRRNGAHVDKLLETFTSQYSKHLGQKIKSIRKHITMFLAVKMDNNFWVDTQEKSRLIRPTPIVNVSSEQFEQFNDFEIIYQCLPNWNKQNHKLYPVKFKQEVFDFLLVNNRYKLVVKDMSYYIIKMLSVLHKS